MSGRNRRGRDSTRTQGTEFMFLPGAVEILFVHRCDFAHSKYYRRIEMSIFVVIRPPRERYLGQKRVLPQLVM
jgi:hypothetical protein